MKRILVFLLGAPQDAKLRDLLVKLHLLKLANFVYHPILKFLQTRNDEDVKSEIPVYFLGEKLLSKNEWSKRLVYVKNKAVDTLLSPKSQTNFGIAPHLENLPLVTVIVSLFNSDSHLASLLENIREQTLFQKSEIVIECAQPSELEKKLLTNFAKDYTNVSVSFHETKLSIYECWNAAINKSLAPFVTNMNADDLRHPQSLEVQAHALLVSGADIVYQDVYYTYEHGLTWQEIEMMGIQSNLPNSVTSDLLISGINPPHNGPMWRRTLHARIGMFDTKYKSAADHDFWIRAALEGAKFFKSEHLTVSYFINPKGMSTKKNSPGSREGADILTKYRKFSRTIQ